MKKYKVISPVVVFGIKGEDGKKVEHSHVAGEIIELPETDISVRAMLQRKQIALVAEEAEQTKAGKK